MKFLAHAYHYGGKIRCELGNDSLTNDGRYEPFTDVGCKFNVIASEEAFIRLPFKHTLWLGAESQESRLNF